MAKLAETNRRRRQELREYHWRNKVRPAVLRRDNWMCHVCGLPIDSALKSPDPMSATVDHIQGAETGYDMRFLRAAHRVCNERRGNPVPVGDPAPRGLTRW